MDITNFLGDVETIADLHNIKEPKHGDSVYVISGGHLYLAIQTKIGIDWKQLRVGRGGRGFPVRPVRLDNKVRNENEV